MGSKLMGQIILQIVLIAMNAVFACAEIAVISMNGNKLDKLAAGGDRRAGKLARLTNQPARFLATIQVAITLSGFLGSAFAADNFSDMLVAGILRLGIAVPEKTLNVIAVVLITIILSFFTLVFGELVPKRIAMRKSEKIALGIAGLVSFISRLFAPVVWLLTASTNAILRLLGIDPNQEDEEISEEEIRMMAETGQMKGIIDEQENEIIQNVFQLDDLSVDEIATHRTELDILWMEDDDAQWRETIWNTNHNFYPVCDGTADKILGILDARRFFRLGEPSRAEILEKAVQKAYLVPDSMRADVLLQKMRETGNSFAMVVDEFGGTFGAVTMTDLLEKLIGDMWEQKEEIQLVSNGEYMVQGGMDLDKFEKKFKLTIDSDCATVGGWVTERLNKLPKPTDAFSYDGLMITVQKTDGKRVVEISVQEPEAA